MRGGNGTFALAASMPGYALRLDVAATKPAALHEGDGYIEYGNGTASFYYSWTRLSASGQLEIDGEAIPVTGTAWMDHQWGDFVTYQGGGWDWFAIQLHDGRDIMLYLIRDPSGRPAIFDGSIVAADGGLTVLEEGDFAITPTGEWISDATGTTYPAGWRVALPEYDLEMTVTPALPDQEVDSRPTTGVIYWEGVAHVVGVEQGTPVTGNAYVELTGYAPYTPIDPATPLATVSAGAAHTPEPSSSVTMGEGLR
jgi:predicted secreted hydrolase